MIVKGYKQTEVGVIPEDWDDREIGLICKITTGSKDTQDKVKEGKYPFYVRSNTVERINSYSFDGEAVLTSGDGVGVGKIFHYLNCKFDYHQRVYKIYGFNETINGKYFFYQFSTNFYDRVMSMTAKSSVDSVRKEMISEMKIPLPPTLKEQEAIAKVLTDTDNLIQGLEDVIAKKKAIKKGAMQQLLTPPNKGGKRLPGFSGEWIEKSLGEVCDVKRGQLITASTKVQGNIPVIAGGKKPAYFHNISNRVGNTITISGSGANAGYVSFHQYDIFASDCSTISESSKYEIRFIYNYLKLIQDKIYKKQTGGAQPHIHPSDINPIKCYMPKTKKEQEAIANILSDMDKEIEALEVKKEKYTQVKKGLAQELLTGKTRLV